ADVDGYVVGQPIAARGPRPGRGGYVVGEAAPYVHVPGPRWEHRAGCGAGAGEYVELVLVPGVRLGHRGDHGVWARPRDYSVRWHRGRADRVLAGARPGRWGAVVYGGWSRVVDPAREADRRDHEPWRGGRL